jgi:hypothetical protein
LRIWLRDGAGVRRGGKGASSRCLGACLELEIPSFILFHGVI